MGTDYNGRPEDKRELGAQDGPQKDYTRDTRNGPTDMLTNARFRTTDRQT